MERMPRISEGRLMPEVVVARDCQLGRLAHDTLREEVHLARDERPLHSVVEGEPLVVGRVLQRLVAHRLPLEQVVHHALPVDRLREVVVRPEVLDRVRDPEGGMGLMVPGGLDDAGGLASDGPAHLPVLKGVLDYPSNPLGSNQPGLVADGRALLNLIQRADDAAEGESRRGHVVLFVVAGQHPHDRLILPRLALLPAEVVAQRGLRGAPAGAAVLTRRAE